MSTIVTVSNPLFLFALSARADSEPHTQAVFGEQNLDPQRIIGL